jgi:hypothetical protein
MSKKTVFFVEKKMSSEENGYVKHKKEHLELF